MAFRAVLFDIGGVVVDSPFTAITLFEEEHGLPPGSVNSVIVAGGAQGAWARLERGELDLEAFYQDFEAESAALGIRLSARAFMEALRQSMRPRPAMLKALERIRERELLTGAITNNWLDPSSDTHLLHRYFDVFVESARTGFQKPDPRIYELTCRELGVQFHQAVFLDDIGRNLKSARSLGMATIKVTDPTLALRELERLLGFPLL